MSTTYKMKSLKQMTLKNSQFFTDIHNIFVNYQDVIIKSHGVIGYFVLLFTFQSLKFENS